MSEKKWIQTIIIIIAGLIPTIALVLNISERDAMFFFQTWGKVSFSAFIFIALWEWNDNKYFYLAFIVASYAFWKIWSDLEILLEVNVIHGFSWDNEVTAPVIPFWLNDGVFYLVMFVLWAGALIIGMNRLKRPF